MTDFGGFRAMFLDFGADPNSIDVMSLPRLRGMIKSMKKRRGVVKPPPVQVRNRAMDEFASFVSSDPSVLLN